MHADTRAEHIDDARDAVAKEHVAGGVVDEAHVALAHELDVVVFEPDAVDGCHALHGEAE